MAGDEFPTTQGKSMPINQLSQQRVTDLHRSYGDAALGKAQGRRFQTTKSGEPRTNTSRLVKSVARQAARLFNAVAPGGRRADPKFREAVRDCSHRAGDLVGALTTYGKNKVGNVSALLLHAQAFAAATQNVAAHDEQLTPIEVATARLDAHLNQLSLSELGNLRSGLAYASMTPSLKPHLSEVDGAVQRQIETRRDAVLKTSLTALATAQNATDRLNAARGAAHELLAMQPLLENPPPQASTTAALQHQLNGLPTGDLARLNEAMVGLLKERGAAEGTVVHDYLALLAAEVPMACESRARNDFADLTQSLIPRLESAIKEADKGDIQAADYQYSPLFGATITYLEKHGLAAAHDTAAPFVKAALVRLCADGKVSEEQVSKLLSTLPSAAQHELAVTVPADVKLSSQEITTFDKLVTNSIDQRLKNSLTRFEQSLGELNTAVDQPAGDEWIVTLSGALDTCVTSLQFLRKHMEANKIDRPDIAQQLDTATASLRESLTDAINARQGLSLDRLDNKSLLALRNGLKAIDLTSMTAPLDDLIDERKEAARKQYAQAVQTCFIKIIENDLDGMLRSLVTVEQIGSQALDVYAQLGEAIDDEDKKYKFRSELAQLAVAGLSPQNANALAARLSSAMLGGVRTALRSGGNALLSDPRYQDEATAKRGKAIAGMDMTLAFLTHELGKQMGTVIDPGDNDDLVQALSAPERQALAAWGVNEAVWSIYATPKTLSNAAIRTFNDNLLTVTKTDLKPPEKVSPAPGVDEAFWLDLPRADYLIEQGDGTLSALLDRNQLAPTGTQLRVGQLRAAIGTLKDMTGSDQQFAAVSKIANQNVMAGFSFIQASADSPIALGTAKGQLLAEQDVSTYTLRKGENGAVLIKFDQTLNRANQIADLNDGAFVALDPETSGARFTVELSVDVNGNVSVHAKPAIISQLKPAKEPS